MGMFSDLTTIGMPIGSTASSFGNSSPGTAPETPPPRQRLPPPSPDAPGVGKAISNFFDRMMTVRTMAYSAGIHSDAAEWMTCVDPSYAFV